MSHTDADSFGSVKYYFSGSCLSAAIFESGYGHKPKIKLPFGVKPKSSETNFRFPTKLALSNSASDLEHLDIPGASPQKPHFHRSRHFRRNCCSTNFFVLGLESNCFVSFA